MDTRRRNNSWIMCFASAFVVATVSSAQTIEYDFQELLLGLTSDSREGQTRAEEEVRRTLKGREREVWNFVLSALADTEGKYDSGHVSEGLRALTVLDGFNDEILDEYRDLLRRESNEIENHTTRQELSDISADQSSVEMPVSQQRNSPYCRRSAKSGRVRGGRCSSFFAWRSASSLTSSRNPIHS